MENKNNVALFSISFLAVGIFLGWLMWGNYGSYSRMMMQSGMHPMANSHMFNGTDMSSMMGEMNTNLSGKKGDVFDQAFIEEMIIHHQGAIDMANIALVNAKHQEIKDMANDIITTQTKEINQMKQWKATWYN